MNLRTPQTAAAVATSRDPRWVAVVARDRSADGTFFYSVATTGVYCRPSCASRRANPKNVRFHRTAADAERAGFRPCRRCRPDQPSIAQQHAAMVAGMCRLIETAQDPPDLAALAREARMSPYYVHRVFKSVTGVTPRAYAAAHRTKRVRAELQKASKTVTEAIYDAGYSAPSRFYEDAKQRLGMTPSAWRDGGRGETIRYVVTDSPLGPLLVAATK